MVDGRNLYEIAAAVLIKESGCTVRRYRKKNTGVAYTHDDDWGIEVPKPRGPISFGTFAHEVAHQLLHRRNPAPRWVEEVEAEQFALDSFDRFGLGGRDLYEQVAAKHLAYSFAKAVRRSKRLVTVIPEKYPEWWRLVLQADTYQARFLRASEGGDADALQEHFHSGGPRIW